MLDSQMENDIMIRPRVASACKDEVEQHVLSNKIRTKIGEYSRALDALDAGSKSLLLAEWVDEFSSFAMWTTGLRKSHSRIFIEECLMYMYVPR